ncbi:MAG: hypothetical protein ACXU82_09130 [Caulobacteraceae bacterium]
MHDRTYRLYHLGVDGRIHGAINRSFADDAEALEHADRLLDSHPAIEIWQTDRLVARRERSETSAHA